MKAAVITGAGKTPTYADFDQPIAKEGETIVSVKASALSNFTRARATGAHYSSSGRYPSVAGTDGVGVTSEGKRVYFAMPEAPFGSLAGFCPIHLRRTVEVPDSLDDVTAAAIANPGMSAWAGLVVRGRLAAGETVLVNGATGTAGRLAVPLAKHLGAARVIATGRNQKELEELTVAGADAIIPFALEGSGTSGVEAYETALREAFKGEIDVVLDYLWGDSAKTILSALAQTVEDRPVRFVHVGGASGQTSIELPGAVLRSAAITLMGSGIGSVNRKDMVQSIADIFAAVGPAGLQVATQVAPLSDVEKVWGTATGKPRVVFVMD